MAKATLPPIHCAECGKEVSRPDRRTQRFCSEKCKKRASNRRQNRRRQPLRDPNPLVRTCLHCGGRFIPARRDQVYCSRKTGKWCAIYAYQARKKAGEPLRQVKQQLHCQECGTEFTALKANARWCSSQCKNRNTGRVMSRRRTGELPRVPYTDREIFERDGWRCHLCGKPVNRKVKRTHPDGATIDHIVPISLGGVDEPANVATAHWHCNHAKKVRALNEQLRLI